MEYDVASQAMAHLELGKVSRHVPFVYVCSQPSPFCRLIDKKTSRAM